MAIGIRVVLSNSLAPADALILPPAEDADPQLLAEQVRQTRGRQANVLGDAGDIKMAVRQMVADVLAGLAHPVVQRGCSDSLIASIRRSSSCSSRFIANSSE